MIDLDLRVDCEIDIAFLEKIRLSITQNSSIVELIILDDEEMRVINLEYRGFDKTTDVLSFPIIDIPNSPIIGTIIISYDRVLDVSKDLGHSKNEEIALLFIHGILHLIGYDHENDNGEMRNYEQKLITTFNLPQSLIIRTEETF